VTATVRCLVVPAAAGAATGAEVAELVVDAISREPWPYDVVVLAQYSLAPAVSALMARTIDKPIFDGPGCAARRLATLLAGNDT
jgi:hypothetical protein